MDPGEALAKERRARLAAERLLQQKQEELLVANRRLSQHAQALSVEVIEKREEVAEVRGDLEEAQTKVTIAERRLWTSLITIKDGFAVFDASDRLVAANPAWLRPFDGVVTVAPGASYADILQVATDEGLVDIGLERPSLWRARMLERWTAPRIEPLTLKLWDGTWVRLIDQRGAGGDIASMALDITQTMRNEARLKEARRRAEAANRAKSAFLANMSHELRTPMNGVVAVAELLGETPLDDEQRGYVETIRNSGEALLVIINDVLDMSKIDAGRLTLHPAPFDLEQVIHEIVQLMEPLVQGKALDLMIDYDMFLPTRFVGDMGRVRQVLTNLIGNAVKFTETGRVLVRVIGFAVEDDPTHRLHVTVEDSGIGIPPEMQAHIFGEFNQVEDERNRKYEGTGLGLAIARRLVRLMGGDIWVDSEVGVGSCFGFDIALPAEPGSEGAADPALAGLTVAVVDPDAAAAALLRSQLASLGMNVLVFPGAAEAAKAESLAAAFADISSGAANELALARPAVPVFGLARSRRTEVAGLAGVLARPIPRRDLRAALTRIAQAPATAPVAPALPAPPVAPAQPARAMRVLAAEDNKTNQMVLSKLVKDLDIDLRFANNGQEAVALQAEWAPDLIFMDISMPIMDGKEATRHIRAAEAGTGRHTPICALTAHALSGDSSEILAAGLDHYLTKPLKKPAILERIEAARPQDCRPVLRQVPVPAVPPGDAAEGGTGHGFLSRRVAAAAP